VPSQAFIQYSLTPSGDSHATSLETVNLDEILLHNSCLDKKVRDILPLITLELDDLTQFRVLDNNTVATELLIQVFQNLVVIEFLLQSLNGC
jgi:hypothetical protein